MSDLQSSRIKKTSNVDFLGMLSCQQTQNVIDGKKRIILNPSETQKRDFEAATFAEGEVYGVDILVSSGEDGKVNSILNVRVMNNIDDYRSIGQG